MVNLGIGIPGLVRNYITEGVQLHAENGLLGYGGQPEPGKEDPHYINAGGQLVTMPPGASVSDSCGAFGLVRSGKLTAVVLGALQVDEQGSILGGVPRHLVRRVQADGVVGRKRPLRPPPETIKGPAAELSPEIVQGDVRRRLGRGVAHGGTADGRHRVLQLAHVPAEQGRGDPMKI